VASGCAPRALRLRQVLGAAEGRTRVAPGRVNEAEQARWPTGPLDVADPALLAPPAAARVLVVVAHPDDVDFGAGGTVAAHVAAGARVWYCIVTDGDAGGFDPAVPRVRVAAQRRDEQRAAAAELGVEDVWFLGYADGMLEPTYELRRDLSAVIRRIRPDRVILQSAERNWERIQASHPDHLAAGEAAMRAVYPDARNPFAHPELAEAGLEPHVVPEVWVMGAPRPNLAVDVTECFEAKLRALRRHRSQVGDGAGLEEMLEGWLGAVAAAAGLGPGRLAEAFRRVRTA
jgi:LmbE family N-acetylglucosaminyl deacetylase